MTNSPYLIRRIRLINFHNFTDETITLENGGHLFLLGDNGCGKTTILDAVHYVLTAGMNMEWNSAARMSGSKRDGRRVQGIILRYNLDTGILNKNGAITYVALEVLGRHGKPLSLGMGISTSAMDETIKFWGIIRECPFADLPFLTEEEGQFRPSSRQEFKEKLGAGRGFFTSKAAYRREIGERIFGGEESYKDICRFLAMGKAYREISAGAADYHALFKSLLPEPRTAIFEQIIEALRTLDESQTILDDLDRKLAWLNGLHDIVTSIAEQRQALLRYDWLLCRFSLHQKKVEQTAIKNTITVGEEQLLLDQAQLAALEHHDRELEERLANLNTKDATGLVRQEKNCRAELTEKKARLDQEKHVLKKLQNRLRRSEKTFQQFRDRFKIMLTKFLPGLAARATTLPFPIIRLQTELDQLSRSPELFFDYDFNIRECIDQSDLHLQETSQDLALLKRQESELTEDIEVQEKTLQEYEKQSEILPDLENFHDCLRTMQQKKLIHPRPLYLGLEWLSTVKVQEKQYIEECIGEHILGTLLLSIKEYPAAREIVAHYPGLRISSADRISESLPDWMRLAFDIQASDPDCLRCLATEMESSNLQPQVSLVDGKPLLAFRSHERAFHDRPARLIGGDSRKKALAAEIRKVKEKLRSLGKNLRETGKTIQLAAGKQETLTTFKGFLNENVQALRSLAREGNNEGQQTDHCRELLEQQQTLTTNRKQEVESLVLRQKELADLISREGLTNLERRIRKLKREKTANRKETENLNRKTGGDEREIEQLRQKLEQLVEELKVLEHQKSEAEHKLLKVLPDVQDIDHFILKTKKGQQFKTSDAIRKEKENSRVAARSGAEQVRMQLNNPEFGGGFRFTYEEGSNELFDFRQQSLAVIIAHQSTALVEQKEVINERTRELFKKIIMTDLMQYLRGHVFELDQMIRRINTLLSDRYFGGQRYRFRLHPLDQFKRLITIIKKISPFDPAAEKELEAFFDDHREAIITTEAGSIPEELDYRNWFRYEMEVNSIGDEGVVMDRRTKSIGSGGEQAVPNYLLILTIAHFLYRGKKTRLHSLLFDEAFYGIDAGRRDQILGFATDLGLQLFIASPDQDGVRREVRNSTTLLVKKDSNYDIHLYPFQWENPVNRQIGLFDRPEKEQPVVFGEEL